MSEKKLYETSINVKAYMTMTVHASSREEAMERFNQYLKEESIDRLDLEIDEYESSVDESDVYETDKGDFWRVDLDDYFKNEEDD